MEEGGRCGRAGDRPRERLKVSLPEIMDQEALGRVLIAEFRRQGVEPAEDLIVFMTGQRINQRTMLKMDREELARNLRKMVTDICRHYVFRRRLLDDLSAEEAQGLKGPVLINDALTILDCYQGLLPPF